MGEREIATLAVPKGLVGGPFGSNLVGKDYVDDGVPVIRGGNMVGRFIGGDYAFVTLEKFARDLARNSAKPGDLIFTQRGTLGQVALVPEGSFDEYVVSQSQMRLRVDASIANPRFVYYACREPKFLEQVSDRAISTGVPHINLGILNELTVPDLPLDEQRSIAEVLGALDDKIAANDRAARSASDLSHAIYLDARRRATKTHTLGDLAGTQYGLTASARDVDGPRFLRVMDINKAPWVEWESAPGCDLGPDERKKYALNAGDILVARMADPGKAAMIDSGDPAAVFASYLVRLIPHDRDQAEYLYYFLRSSEYKAYVEANASGSVQKNMNAKVIVGVDIVVPENSTLQEFNSLVRPLRQSIRALRRESAQVARTRDELLPLLMSGKLRVRNVDAKALV